METIIIKNLSSDSPNVKVSEKGSKGRAGVVWRDDWVGTSDYYVGDAVQYLGTSYICKKFIAAKADAYPSISTTEWHIFSSRGSRGETRTSYSPLPPTGICSITSHSNETACLSNGGAWENSIVGDLWIESTTDEVYILLSTSPNDWRDLSKNVTSTDVGVTAHNNLPAGNLQDALEHLEDQLYQQVSAPTGANVEEGDLWYDTTLDRMNVYRDNTWVLLVTRDALAQDTGYDEITMNGGYF